MAECYVPAEVETSAEYLMIVRGYDASVSCDVTSAYTPSNCTWHKDGEVVATEESFLAGDSNTFTCTHSLLVGA